MDTTLSLSLSRVQVRLSTRHALTYAPLALRDAGKHKRLTPGAWDFLEPLEDIDATHAVLAEVDGKLVGWFRCTIQEGPMPVVVGRERRLYGLYRRN